MFSQTQFRNFTSFFKIKGGKSQLRPFLKMQQADGSVLHKVSATTYTGTASPPSDDMRLRRYAPATSSATISACGAFAHAAMVYASLGNSDMDTYANELKTAALNAWNWLADNPTLFEYDNAGFVNADAVDPVYNQTVNKACAAIYLYALTGDTQYRDYFDNQWPEFHLYQWWYVYPFESEYQYAVLFYTQLSNATPAVVTEIQERYTNSVSGQLDNYLNQTDAYLSFVEDQNYGWGSNRTKSYKGLMFNNMLLYNLVNNDEQDYLDASAFYIHYIHGLNPLSWVYLSNMNEYGAEKSVNEFYHSWFTDGSVLWDRVGESIYGPPPGYLTGGVNPNYSPDPSYNGTIEPPQSQPIQKSYHDWNTSWPENSWEVTENSITYQAAYIKLLSAVMKQSDCIEPCTITIQIEVLLGGAYEEANGLMRTDLNDNATLPETQPYNIAPWNYSGLEQIDLNNPAENISDWILLELVRASDTSTVYQKAALLLNDGRVQDTDLSVNGLLIESLDPNQQYFVIIRHRNHLDIASSIALSLTEGLMIDFRLANNVMGGAGQLYELSDGNYAMIPGDFDGNGSITIADYNKYKTELSLLNGYFLSDCDLNHSVTVSDFNLFQNNISWIGVNMIRY